MIVLGINGGLDPSLSYLKRTGYLGDIYPHDSAAAIIVDGALVAAIEEERFTRVKHTDRFPSTAIRECCDMAGVQIERIDHIGFTGLELVWDEVVKSSAVKRHRLDFRKDARSLIAEAFHRDLHVNLDPTRISFVEHHMAHACSAFYFSGFRSSLILTTDGSGDHLSETISVGTDASIIRLFQQSDMNSLGALYLLLTRALGFEQFGEYKVMGLASYGDPRRFAHEFASIYSLEEHGKYLIFWDRIPGLLRSCLYTSFSDSKVPENADFAASLQDVLERILLHQLSYYRSVTRMDNLCLAGGVALNCSVVAKIERSGIFQKVFVQPAAHDAGCAVGSAAQTYLAHAKEKSISFASRVYLGCEISTTQVDDIERTWGAVVTCERTIDPALAAAGLLADGNIIGWAQGRGEFGPRALGNRSILADPRLPHNRDRINKIIKRREIFRPFAPSVLDSFESIYLDVPEACCNTPYMTSAVAVRKEFQADLAAAIHVDGTARVHRVDAASNRLFHRLITCFYERVGVAAVLNTSFNVAGEPIINSVHEAVQTLVISSLDALVIGDTVVRRSPDWKTHLLNMSIYVRPEAVVSKTHFPGGSLDSIKYTIARDLYPGISIDISEPMYLRLSEDKGKSNRVMGEMRDAKPTSSDVSLSEIVMLLELNLIFVKNAKWTSADAR